MFVVMSPDLEVLAETGDPDAVVARVVAGHGARVGVGAAGATLPPASAGPSGTGPGGQGPGGPAPGHSGADRVGAASDLARRAARSAATHPHGVVVRGVDPRAAREAGAVLSLLADLAARRTPGGGAVVDLLAGGATQAAAARTLGVTRQAVSQRALAAGWHHQRDLSPLAAALLAAAADAGTQGGRGAPST